MNNFMLQKIWKLIQGTLTLSNAEAVAQKAEELVAVCACNN